MISQVNASGRNKPTLYEGFAGHGQEGARKRSPAEKSTEWCCGPSYQHYKTRKYCGGKLSFPSFVCASICLFICLLLVILIPVIYCIVIPNEIQRTFDAVVKSGGAGIQRLAFSPPPPNSPYNFHIDATIPAQTWIPGTAELVGQTPFYFSDSRNSGIQPWGTLLIGPVSLAINKESQVGIDGTFSLQKLPSLNGIIQGIIGMNYPVFIRTQWTIKMWGIQWYANLPLYSEMDLNSQTGRQLLQILQALANGAGFGTAGGRGGGNGFLPNIPGIPGLG